MMSVNLNLGRLVRRVSVGMKFGVRYQLDWVWFGVSSRGERPLAKGLRFNDVASRTRVS